MRENGSGLTVAHWEPMITAIGEKITPITMAGIKIVGRLWEEMSNWDHFSWVVEWLQVWFSSRLYLRKENLLWREWVAKAPVNYRCYLSLNDGWACHCLHYFMFFSFKRESIFIKWKQSFFYPEIDRASLFGGQIFFFVTIKFILCLFVLCWRRRIPLPLPLKTIWPNKILHPPTHVIEKWLVS